MIAHGLIGHMGSGPANDWATESYYCIFLLTLVAKYAILAE
jgi:hypothetical protein